jgi:hypothetical protein
LALRERVGLGEVLALGPAANGRERSVARHGAGDCLTQELLLVGQLDPHGLEYKRSFTSSETRCFLVAWRRSEL